ncbi:ABC transporter ATP-binding protein [[Clostridium] aminophilum]|uniref:ABC transporter ATP-binding protein n=1 Tax=[Clostridium] aminophilum TaxID=1526 RepID=UPI003F9432A2
MNNASNNTDGCKIRLEALSAGYDGKPLVKDVSLNIRAGEIVALIGPNGAGKSTILKTVIRQLPAVSGRILLDGEDVSRIPSAGMAKKTAVVLTDRIQAESMTCRDVASAGRYPYTGRLGILSAEDERKVDEALRLVEAEDIQDRLFAKVSDGQRQRILLARALCQEPEIIVLDEPTSFLDIRYKLHLLGILRKLSRERRITVIMSLHEIDLAEKTADHILCIDADHETAYGTPEEIFREEKIRELFHVERGHFDPVYGSVEMEKPSGEPRVFVISNGGRGIPVYRKLQRDGIPFAAGILTPNDMDYPVAKHLAAEVITEKAFSPLTEDKVEKALVIASKCRRIIDAGTEVGPVNEKIRRLLEMAEPAEKYFAESPIPSLIPGTFPEC